MKVHIVEDEQSISKAISEYLTKNTDFEVTKSQHGNEATDNIIASAPDVVVIDIFLPGKDGLEVLAEMRQVGISAPVIIFTNMSLDIVDVERLAKLGVKKLYLKAETSLDKLVSAIRELG
jgi:DNA-binding NarL/FixJ family response regulator